LKLVFIFSIFIVSLIITLLHTGQVEDGVVSKGAVTGDALCRGGKVVLIDVGGILRALRRGVALGIQHCQGHYLRGKEIAIVSGGREEL
jgi:hypothetical protein